MGWTLRIRYPAGQSTLSLENEGSTTCTQLQSLIQAQAGIAAAAQELLGGFPPKPLQVASQTWLLVFLKLFDVLTAFAQP